MYTVAVLVYKSDCKVCITIKLHQDKIAAQISWSPQAQQLLCNYNNREYGKDLSEFPLEGSFTVGFCLHNIVDITKRTICVYFK